MPLTKNLKRQTTLPSTKTASKDEESPIYSNISPEKVLSPNSPKGLQMLVYKKEFYNIQSRTIEESIKFKINTALLKACKYALKTAKTLKSLANSKSKINRRNKRIY